MKVERGPKKVADFWPKLRLRNAQFKQMQKMCLGCGEKNSNASVALLVISELNYNPKILISHKIKF